MSFVQFFDILTIVISVIIGIKNYKRVVNGSRYIVYFLFVFFYIIPLVLDYVYMMPSYIRSRYVGFLWSQEDAVTRIVYDCFVIYTQLIILQFRNAKSSAIKYDHANGYSQENNYLSSNKTTLLVFFMVLPVLLSFIFPVNKGILYTLQWRENNLFAYNSYISYLEKLAYIGIFASTLMMLNKNIILRYRILCFCFLYMNICIQGKRASIFFFLLVLIVSSIPGLKDENTDIKNIGRKLVRLSIIAISVLVLIAILTIYVKIHSRGYDPTNSLELYTQIRIDLFRDDRVRMALFSLIHPDRMKILQYPMQTIITMPCSLFPIDIVLGSLGINPPSYAYYLSAALENLSLASSSTFMTPCIAAELISNMGYIGLLFFPFLCIWFANLSDKFQYPNNVAILISFVAIQMFAVPYMNYLLEFVFILCISTKVRFVYRYRR